MDTELKSPLEILISLRNEQQEVVMNRLVSISMLKKLKEKDPNRVLTVKMDMQEIRPKPITVTMRLQEMEEAYEMDELRLQELDEMIEKTKVVK